jgi:hypothetical protein
MSETLVHPAERNLAAANALTTIGELVNAENAAGLIPAPSFEAYQTAARTVNQTAAVAAAMLKVGDTVHTADGPLVIAWQHSSTTSIDVVLTSDGGPQEPVWHTGPESDAMQVRYESWTLVDNGKDVDVSKRSHGYLDAASRRIVQTG